MNRLNRKIVLFGLLLFVVMLCYGAVASMPDGEAVFMVQKCNTCHRFKGQGGIAGPDLTEVSKRRTSLWIMRQIINPKSHNPDSRMPEYGHLGHREIWAIVSYLKS